MAPLLLRITGCLLLYTTVLHQHMHAQIGQTRRTVTAFPMAECNASGAPITGATVQPSPINAAFRVWNVDTNGNLIIYFLEWKNGQRGVSDTALFDLYNYAPVTGARNGKTLVAAKAAPANRRYFLIDKDYLVDSLSVRNYSTWRHSASFMVGTVTMPVKARLSNFDFGANISLGPTFGCRMRTSRHKDRHIALLGALNIGVVDVDSFSSKGAIIGQPVKNVGVLSPAVGFMFEADRAQAGLFLGVDLMSRYNWIYQGRPYLSLGFGYALFSKSSETATSTGSKQ